MFDFYLWEIIKPNPVYCHNLCIRSIATVSCFVILRYFHSFYRDNTIISNPGPTDCATLAHPASITRKDESLHPSHVSLALLKLATYPKSFIASRNIKQITWNYQDMLLQTRTPSTNSVVIMTFILCLPCLYNAGLGTTTPPSTTPSIPLQSSWKIL